VLVLFGRNPLRAYADIFSSTLGSTYGFSETLVKMSPLMLTALGRGRAVTDLAHQRRRRRQLFVGAMCATWAAIHLTGLPSFLLLTIMAALGVLGGGLWAAIAGALRASGG
jgi:simple sugar transport system permease protein